MQKLVHFTWCTWASIDLGVCGGPGNQPLTDNSSNCTASPLALVAYIEFAMKHIFAHSG